MFRRAGLLLKGGACALFILVNMVSDWCIARGTNIQKEPVMQLTHQA